ncbi:MAG: hypothetical protein KC547_00705 [Anaerolineae bacterium]|nr:hypothetical protein [Anaerolineae bacterium]MCA9910035.1 hypothetical protein [Anaerolineae bacterium]
MRRLLAILASVITIGVGLVTIYDLTVGDGGLAAAFLRLAAATLALMIAAGVINLIIVHVGRILRLKRGWVYSLVLLISAFATVGFWLAGQTDVTNLLLNSVQVPVESALAGLLFFALVYGAYRLLHKRFSWASLLFVIVLLILLVGALPLEQVAPARQIRDWFLSVPVSAGARGILFGIALATIVTGVRVLVGQDRSYRE